MSIEYYSKLERGALAGRLGLRPRRDRPRPAARRRRTGPPVPPRPRRRRHQRDHRGRRRRTAKRWTPRPSLQWALDAITDCAGDRPQRPHGPARHQPSRPGHALIDLYDSTPATPPNFARFTFLDHDSRGFYPDWDLAADICVAILRTEAGRDPHDKGLHDLVGELSTRSEDFRRRWAAHNVRLHGTGTKHFHHHVVGELTLAYESLDMVAEPGLTLTIYAAEPDSPTADALALLASWAATHTPTTVQPT